MPGGEGSADRGAAKEGGEEGGDGAGEPVQRLEAEKEGLERDLSFKADQAKQYDGLLEAVRENNRQLQVPVCVCLCV